MNGSSVTVEKLQVLRVLQRRTGSLLREIHAELVEMEKSKFQFSPEFGDGWNEERKELFEIKNELANRGLIKNDYQRWRLSDKGRDVLTAQDSKTNADS